MTISKVQLETWEKLGAQESSKNTYRTLKNFLEKHEINKTYDFEIYLQGSYGNDTNIYGNSDVDIIVCLTSIYRFDISGLSEVEQNDYWEDFVPATKTLEQFKNDVINALNSNYDVEIKNKCLKISNTSLDADIVVCMEYRLYKSYSKYNKSNYIEGIYFKTSDNEEIINYPKIHKSNGRNKSSNTNNIFKRTVRIFKNIKSKLVNDDILSKNDAPSYFVECLIYNSPDGEFVNNVQDRTLKILLWLEYIRDDNELNDLVCQNQVENLFGSSDQQWDIKSARKFINEAIKLWNGE